MDAAKINIFSSETEGDEEINDTSSILLKVANLYASQLMSDITLVVNDIKWVIKKKKLSWILKICLKFL